MIVKGTGSYRFNFEFNIDMDRAEFDILSLKEQDEIIKKNIDPVVVNFFGIEIDEDVEF